MSYDALFDPPRLLEEASAATGGLDNFGDGSFRPGLNTLCKALATEAGLSEMGANILRQKILGQLINRLRVEHYFKAHPEITAEVVAPPLVIVGLPRTGTTKLHRLLSRDRRFYWMAFWESQFPVPFPNETLEQPTARIKEARGIVDLMTQAMPKLMAIHPMATEEADEEVMLMEHSFLSAFDAYANIPSYTKWLDAQDQTPAYLYLRRMLQFLQWQKRKRGVIAERWVLKTPHHLLRMDTLLRVFPGARIVQTHRDPVQSIPSIASFIHTLWAIYSNHADPAAAGRTWSDRMARALKHTMSVRTHVPQDVFLDVAFRDTVSQPMEVVKQVYALIDTRLHGDAADAMERWLAEDAMTHQGGHEYTAEQFGLSEEQIKRDFWEYRAMHIETPTAA